jgi:hypothetical protein
MAMEGGIRSLWRYFCGFVGFWLAFVCAVLCNSLIPLQRLRQFYPSCNYIIPDSWIAIQAQVINGATSADGSFSIAGACLSLMSAATASFIGYFREIFVIVTVFQFTPIHRGIIPSN